LSFLWPHQSRQPDGQGAQERGLLLYSLSGKALLPFQLVQELLVCCSVFLPFLLCSSDGAKHKLPPMHLLLPVMQHHLAMFLLMQFLLQLGHLVNYPGGGGSSIIIMT